MRDVGKSCSAIFATLSVDTVSECVFNSLFWISQVSCISVDNLLANHLGIFTADEAPLATKINEQFGCEVVDDWEVHDCRTVQDLIDVIAQNLGVFERTSDATEQ